MMRVLAAGIAFMMIGVSALDSAGAADTLVPAGNPADKAHSLTNTEMEGGKLFCRTGTDKVEDFTAVLPTHTFDAVNGSTSHLMIVFEPNSDARVTPNIVRIAPGERRTIEMVVASGSKSFTLSYAVSCAPTPFNTHADRYRAYNDGETVMCVPVSPSLHAAMDLRAESIVMDSKTLVTDKDMPSGTYIYTPGPTYRTAGIFARDFLYQLEGSGRDTVTADEVKRAVDFLALKQLSENRKVGEYTYPKGAIPDHVYPDGRYCWGPGMFYGDDTAHFNRPSMDEAMCFITLAWHYGCKAGWDLAWQSWFSQNAQRFVAAWNSLPRNPKTGLITQWTTAGHIGANGITENTGPSVMWGFHDSYGFPGDDVGTSVLACNAARALADMFGHASDPSSARTWSTIADTMRDAIRMQFNSAGYLPWGVGAGAPTMASPDITGYAVWSGILTDAQQDAASDWLAARYNADKAAGGAADLFNMTIGCRGSVRMARKADDVTPGSHVWPHTVAPHWENLAHGYNAYQDGAYWYYMSLGVAVTLYRKHPEEAREWVANAYTDISTGDSNQPYERIDGITPANNRYNASVGPLLGIGLPARISTICVSVVDR